MVKDSVLIIENDTDWLTSLSCCLDNEGFACIKALNYHSAIQLLQSQNPLAITLDMRLSDCENLESDWGGWALAKQAEELGIASVVVSGAIEGLTPASRLIKEFGVIFVFDKGDFYKHRSLFTQKVAEAVEITRRRRAALISLKIDRPRLIVSLQFESTREKTILRIVSSPLGEPRCEFIPPFSGLSKQKIFELIRGGRADFSRLTQNEEELLKQSGLNTDQEGNLLQQIGLALYNALATDKVGMALNNLVATGSMDGLQIRLDDESVELAQFPWELIYNSNDFLALGQISLSRYVTCFLGIPKLGITFPSRILMVVPRPLDLSRLPDVEDQAIQAMAEDTGLKSKYEFCRPPKVVTYDGLMSTLEDAQRAGKPFKIVFFDGHGDYGWQCRRCNVINSPDVQECFQCKETHDRQHDLEGFIHFVTASGTSCPISARKLATAFAKVGVQIVILNACNTAQADGKTLFNAVAPKLIGQMIPVVIGMQFPIATSDTLPFFTQFFKVLASGEAVTITTVEEAVKSARKYIASERWFYPVLYLRAQ